MLDYSTFKKRRSKNLVRRSKDLRDASQSLETTLVKSHKSSSATAHRCREHSAAPLTRLSGYMTSHQGLLSKSFNFIHQFYSWKLITRSNSFTSVVTTSMLIKSHFKLKPRLPVHKSNCSKSATRSQRIQLSRRLDSGRKRSISHIRRELQQCA